MYFVQATYHNIDTGYKYLFELDAEDACEADDRISRYLQRKYGLQDNEFEALQICLDGKDWEGKPYYNERYDNYTFVKL